jgi:hypothetical protein
MLSVNLLPTHLRPLPRAAYGSGKSQRVYIREWQLRRRWKIIEKLGGKCASPDCLVVGGCTDKRVLHVDHVNNDGATERNRSSPNSMYRKVLLDTEGRYQLLCANCNVTKEYERLKAETDARNAGRH